MEKLTPVILCGGSGTRLWPLSRKDFPKQFAALLGPESLFQATAKRFATPEFAAPMVVTASDFRFVATEQLAEAGVDPGAVLIEPSARNTAPAALAAALHLAARDPDALMILAPSDHAIADAGAFRAAVARGVPEARAGKIVTFGVRPTRPETGYGWIEVAAVKGDAPVALRRFVEKPDRANAEKMLSAGNFFWNMGVFLCAAKTLIAAYEEHAADLVAPVRAAVERAGSDLGFVRLDESGWNAAPAISIDYAVMERAANLVVVPYESDWSDLGDWQAVHRATAGEAPSDQVTAIDCTDTLLRSESAGQEIVGIGLKGIIAVAMPDAVLVADSSRAQEVRLAVDALRAKGATQATSFPRNHRPWGWYETLVMGGRFQVKRIVVHPGGRLSLQSHVHRSEHWVVVSGTARVTVGEEVRLLTENESTYIPLGAVHRLENPGKLPTVLIEVQTGAYLGEDDITRYDDIYARVTPI